MSRSPAHPEDARVFTARQRDELAEITEAVLSGGYDGTEGEKDSRDSTFTDFGIVCGIAAGAAEEAERQEARAEAAEAERETLREALRLIVDVETDADFALAQLENVKRRARAVLAGEGTQA